jgi:hypothetical protein
MTLLEYNTDCPKLCCGILATTDVKVDYKKLADYMGEGRLDKMLCFVSWMTNRE